MLSKFGQLFYFLGIEIIPNVPIDTSNWCDRIYNLKTIIPFIRPLDHLE